MLSAQQIQNIADELQANYRLLDPDIEQVLSDLDLNRQELIRVLTMTRPNPEHVRQVRDYLLLQLEDQGIEAYTSPASSPRTNRWFR